ncbi:MAG: SEL1-like repeat protein [Candidatus Methanoplasma sp.]|jgi:TPR repeat protein|nr:SEL1-like repeat protein [Candidatus Methanoplasma sp.]
MSNKKGFVFENGGGSVEVDIGRVRELAAGGDSDGLYALGMACLFGWETEQNVEKGFRLLENACDAGNPEAMTLLVSMYISGDYARLTPAKALEYTKTAAAAGVAKAQLFLGSAYLHGTAVDKDYKRAEQLFRDSARQGNAEARSALAYMYQHGLGVARDDVKAFKLYKNAASAGCVNAQYHTAACFETGVGTSRSLRKASEWYSKAAAAGDAESMFRLGAVLENGSGDLPKDRKGAFNMYVRAAELGNTDAMYAAALCHLEGSTDEDRKEALRWLDTASDAHHEPSKELAAHIRAYAEERDASDGGSVAADAKPDAAHPEEAVPTKDLFPVEDPAPIDSDADAPHPEEAVPTGEPSSDNYSESVDSDADSLYREGIAIMTGSSPDTDRAAALFAAAAEAGSIPAKRELGLMHITGSGVKADPVRAYNLISEAAVALDPTAMYDLALMYECGIGTEKDIYEAIRMMAFAADAGCPDAEAEARRMDSAITAEREAKLRSRPLLNLDVSDVDVEAACCKRMFDGALEGSISVVDTYKGPELVMTDENGIESIVVKCPFCGKGVRRVPRDKKY